eukprot:scaffold109934_cov41-Prasinocladus_malaysianus.AAC.1
MGGHYTQVIWRASEYVGCGEAGSSAYGYVQVCRYIRPGNCNGKSNYMEASTPCGPFCPEEGCSAEPTIAPTTAPTTAPTISPTASPTEAPSPVLTTQPPAQISSKTCAELGFDNHRGDPNVCGDSKWPGQTTCLSDLTWTEADLACTNAGARLCTLAELENEEARGTGCKFDTELVWAKDMCQDGAGHIKARGREGNRAKCVTSSDAVAYVRCCADA